MKGLALESIAYMIIAIFTIIVIIGLIGSKLSPSIRNQYCNVLRGMRGILPIPSSMKPSLPSYCESNDISFKTEFIEGTNPEYVKEHLSAYIIACWETTGKVNSGQSKNCYEVVLKNDLENYVTQNDILQILTDEGYSNVLQWNAGDILSKGSISIKYNSDLKLIEVS